MKTQLIPLSILVAVLGHAAESAPALVLPSANEVRTNAASRLFASPQVIRRLYEAYALQNPADPDYHEKLAAAMERYREQLSGMLARQQQELSRLKTQDATPVLPPDPAPLVDPALALPLPAEGSEVPTQPEDPPVTPPAREPQAANALPGPPLPSAMEESYHRLLIELQSASPILLKVHTNAPASGAGQ